MSYRIVLAEDNLLFRQYVKQLIEEDLDLQVVGEAGDGQELLGLVENCVPDLVILDLSMPNLNGLEALKRIKVSHPQVKVLILTMHKNPAFLQQALSSGARGYLPKDGADLELITAIQLIRQDQVYISPIMGNC